MSAVRPFVAMIAAAGAALVPARARTAPEPWRPDRAAVPVEARQPAAASPPTTPSDPADRRPAHPERSDAGGRATSRDAVIGTGGGKMLEVVPTAVAPSLPSLTDAILALPIVEEHRDDAGRLVRLARDPSGATVRYVIGADGRIAELEVWPGSTK